MERVVNQPLLCPQIIGRTPEFAALALLVEQARGGQSHIALIAGDAGIGKSRLVSELKSFSEAQGFLIIQGVCFPTDITYPYAPLLDLLRSLVTSDSQMGLSGAVEALARDIYPLLPELVLEPPSSLPNLEPEQEKHRLFAVLATFLLHLTTRMPLLLIIEDVHWSDDTSLDFLHYLMRRSASHPLLLAVTYRQDEIQPKLSNWLAQLDRERLAHEIHLMPLARNDVDRMLSIIFEERHTSFDMRRFLHGELLEVLYSLTEGNPFFVEETLSSLIATGDISYMQGFWQHRSGSKIAVPRSVQDAVQQRTAHVSEAARQVLTLAAVAGKQFDFALLQELTHYDEQELLFLMKELVAAQLVIEASADQFAFRHALTRRAIYNQLLTRERRMLHRTIAETLERQASGMLDFHLEDLATHFYQAREWQKTIDYAQRAGEKALRLYSHRAAIDYFSWALEAMDQLSLPPSPAIYRTRGQAHEMLGEFEQAQKDYTYALEAARKIGDHIAEWQSTIDLGFLWAGRDYAQVEIWFRQALMLSQREENPLLHAHSLNRIGNWHLNVEQAQEALHYHQEALAIFEQQQDSRGVAETLDLLGMTSYLGGDLARGTTYYQQAIALFDEQGNREGLTSSLAALIMRASTFHTDVLVAVASLTEVLSDVERALMLAREIGQRSAESYALFQVGVCLGSQGEYTRALVACQQSLHIAEEIEHRQWQTAAHAMLGGVYNSLLAHEQARGHFEQALTLAQEMHSLFWTRMATGYLSSTFVQLHDLASAEALLDASLNADTPAETLGQRMVWCASAELALAQKQPTHALEIIHQLKAFSTQVGGGEGGLRILKLYGETLCMLERLSEAEVTFKRAQEVARMQGARPMLWRICIALGNLYHMQGKNTEAEQEFASASALIEELAVTIADEGLREQFLRRASAGLPQKRPLPSESGRSTKQASGGLTAREREVAILIAQGKSNQSIADTLVVTKRTVETHISNIMFKLDCTSRTQIAVWTFETGLISKTEIEKAP